MKGLLRLWRRTPVARVSRGQALVWAAVMLPSMLMITMLGLDMGRVVMVRRALQNSVDAAALAGAWKLPEDSGGATTEACLYVETNAVPEMTWAGCGGKADVTFPTTTRITVTSVRDVVPMFGSIVPLDFATIPVGADATAMVGSIRLLCTFPLFQTQNLLEASGAWQPNGADLLEFNVPMVMKTTSN
ncbi:MAG: TadE/TadG family type IV pilus assembly protein, partial [Thermomicrobiales bacterium]